MLLMALHRTALCLLFRLSCSWATPLPFYSLLEGSTDEEELTNSTSFLPTSNSSSEYQTTPAGPTHVETEFLNQVRSFLEENMLLILVACSFILLFLFIICGAIFMSRRRKVNAYYPSSFPSKMYVDHKDKTGGAKLFNEVPEKAKTQRTQTLVRNGARHVHREREGEWRSLEEESSLKSKTQPHTSLAGGGALLILLLACYINQCRTNICFTRGLHYITLKHYKT
uniref:Transmembrane protein 119b n=1 Tax=Labrus bergylta TaxID=56723 RepID=A0A3Q3FSZ8_9LABR